MHQTIENQAIRGMSYPNWEAFFDYCQQRRKILNQTYPCSSLNNKAPLQVFPNAKHSGKYYHLQLEEKLIDLNRFYAFLAKGQWFRWMGNTNHLISLGGYKYYVPEIKYRTQIKISFDPQTLQLLFHDDKELVVARKPIKGISKKTLMGDLYWKVSNVQLEFPFSWEIQKLNTTLLDNT